MAFTPPIGSVVAFQSDPTKLVGTVSVVGTLPVVLNNSSIISVQQGSVATVIVGGSIAASFTPPANQSVSGAVSISNFPTTQNVSGSVVATQGTNPWTVTSSIAGGIFPVSGSVSAVVTNNVTVVSSIAGGIFPISGSVAATIVGTPNVNTAGSVVAFQGTSPWVVNYQNSSIIAVATGSVLAIQSGTQTSSVVSSNPSSMLTGASIFGQLPAGTAMIGSIAAYQGSIPWTINSVYGNISGSVAATVTNTVTVVSSIAGGLFPISGSVAATIVGTPNINTAGSVVAFQGAAPWLQTFSNSSILAVPVGSYLTIQPAGSIMAVSGVSISISSVVVVGGSIISVPSGSVISVAQGSVATVQIGQSGTVMTSVAGTYASNSASIISGLGVLNLGVRNDTLSSVLATTDGKYSPYTIGPWGEQVVSNAPGNKWVSGVGSLFTGVPQPIITSTLGAFVNVTGVQIANASANNVYVSFSGAGLGSVAGSIIGYTVAPANGGSNIYFANALKTGVNNPFQASVSGVASVFVSAQGFLSNT